MKVSLVFLSSFMILCVSSFKSRSRIRSFASDDDLSIEHLKEHYGNKIDIEKHTSAGDRKFYYFKVGDSNKDNNLDGIELFKLIIEHADEDGGKMEKIDVESIEVQVDQVISDMDKNQDGMISFSEYSRKFAG
ncbi:hypothetical protein GCK72_009160 [Caenorhabditis remanei]|uniref:Uncharacterized protein n=2 Tax=Caenorhabditis remanei TaxID=31234 RepID=A0A2P4VE66_CAERE|nr:hypothetical protein GCK72_009160 [Caenorhabditis remanei]KAF1760908.1 hypothetical protein GCK72_009160 [Caenorhabditis remanei]